jgi:hypothetical protein
VMRPDQKTGAFTRQKFANRLDFFCTCLLFRDRVIQAEDHYGVGITQNRFAEGQPLAGLINSLVNDDGLSRSLADDVLRSHGRQVE